LAVGFAIACGLAIAVAYDELRSAHEVGDTKSGLGNAQLALHFEDLAALAFGIALLSAFCAIVLVLRDPWGERALIALGAVVAIGVPLWISMSWWP
jgi:hypothetical protein